MNFQVPARRIMLFANYAYLGQENDADGPFGLPADNYDAGNEWGPVLGIPRHSLSSMFSLPLIRNMRLSLNGGVRSGTPYNITTGLDDNGDTVFNDRPAGVGRNAGRTAMTWDVGGRLSYAFGFGRRPQADGAPGQPVMIMHRVGGPGGNEIGGSFGGGADDKRIRFELFVSGSNLFNAVNRIGYSGVMTSPFFGEPTRRDAGPPCGMRRSGVAGGGTIRQPGLRRLQNRSIARKYGSASAASSAAQPNAVAKPYRWISQPIVVEPVPMPVSNAARIAPNAAPRRSGRTCFIT